MGSETISQAEGPRFENEKNSKITFRERGQYSENNVLRKKEYLGLEANRARHAKACAASAGIKILESTRTSYGNYSVKSLHRE